jgi:hypothetical protein
MIKLGVLAARPADRGPLPDKRHDRRRDRRLHPAPPAAGRDGDLFSDAIAQIHDAARGKPRTVNNLALQALVATYATAKKIVDQSARAAVSEVISAERARRRHHEQQTPPCSAGRGFCCRAHAHR